MKAKKILVVEDERLVAEDIAECLRSRDFEVCGICNNGPVAIAAAREHLPDLVMMDIIIQGDMDGIETAAVLREELDLPVVFLTAYSQEGILERAKKVDPLGYVVKPFEEGSLLSTVEIALHKSRLDRELRESEEWFSTTLNSIGDGVIATDECGKIKFLNGLAEELTGWSSIEADTLHIEEVFTIVSEGARNKVANPALEALESGQICGLANHTILIRKDGSEFPIDDSAAPIHNPEGIIVGAVLVFRDVTEKKESEKKVQRYQQRLEELVDERTQALAKRIELERLVIELSSDLIRLNEETYEQGLFEALERIGRMLRLDGCGIHRVAAEGEVKLFQAEAAWATDRQMLGFISGSWNGSDGRFPWWEEQLDAHGHIMVRSRDEVPAEAVAEQQMMETCGIESLVVLPLGQVSPLRSTVSFSSRNPRAWIEDDLLIFEMLAGVLKNVLERREMEIKQRALQEQLNQSQKLEAIGKLSGGIAHDFNNMLVPIMGYADVILDDPERNGNRKEVEEIRRAAESAASLTRQLLAFSRKQILLKRNVGLNLLIPEMEGMLQRILGEDIDFQVDIDKDLRPVEADRGQLEQVIMNLCVNARDAMPQGGRLGIRGWNGKDGLGDDIVMIAVQDSGTGMSQDVMDKVFDPFFSTKGLGGTGLGLSVVLGIVQQHGGTVKVDSEEGVGTRFTIVLPASPVETSPEPQEGQKGECHARTFQGNGERILLVEDEPGVAQFVSRALEKHDYNVVVASNKASAIQIYDREEGRFDMVFTDAKLPDGTGIEVLEHVFAHRPEIRVLLSSGYTDDRAQIDQARRRGVQFMQKPYALKELRETVFELLQNQPSSSGALAEASESPDDVVLSR